MDCIISPAEVLNYHMRYRMDQSHASFYRLLERVVLLKISYRAYMPKAYLITDRQTSVKQMYKSYPYKSMIKLLLKFEHITTTGNAPKRKKQLLHTKYEDVYSKEKNRFIK